VVGRVGRPIKDALRLFGAKGSAFWPLQGSASEKSGSFTAQRPVTRKQCIFRLASFRTAFKREDAPWLLSVAVFENKRIARALLGTSVVRQTVWHDERNLRISVQAIQEKIHIAREESKRGVLVPILLREQLKGKRNSVAGYTSRKPETSGAGTLDHCKASVLEAYSEVRGLRRRGHPTKRCAAR
jgi:hypothetical protein